MGPRVQNLVVGFKLGEMLHSLTSAYYSNWFAMRAREVIYFSKAARTM
jgi:hypothetical protein